MKNLLLLIILIYSFNILSGQSKRNLNFNEPISNINTKDAMIFWESFEGAEFPPTDWTQNITDSLFTWEKASSFPQDGQYFVHVLYDELDTSIWQNEWLITKSINLIGYQSVILNFYFQMSKYWGIKPYDNYDLYVIAANDGVNFTDTIWSELSTDTSTWTSWEWVNAQIDLTNYIGSNQLKLAFVYYGRDGAEASIDAISISTTGNLYDNNLDKLQIYPNPTSDYLYIEAPYNTRVQIYDLLGNEIYNKLINDKLCKIDLHTYPCGIYILKLIRQNISKTFKIVKN
ncbi:MAG: T9SS type A sorting domain-containing protein [Bacteroidales bacterium]|jgi:hypothetical protein|nr:T9SS type A sorting domain-containing protein [Bacteroidales bacterium]MDI9575560.1 T9SS type A sorting domain-containing protein [Bacteroidota bacterium]MDD2593166.1 T9SS type A sorting domain-containing protein [Bacteroidales bacterium]MDD3755641.1 T9SS type A sorting domain-containing protein [Bacteroidales bacterium]MDY0401372.1 T9SS type A sorting domain-containing protein [Bacteroidales bacterium]